MITAINIFGEEVTGETTSDRYENVRILRDTHGECHVVHVERLGIPRKMYRSKKAYRKQFFNREQVERQGKRPKIWEGNC